MARSKQAIVDEVLEALSRQGFVIIDRDGNCFARAVHDTNSRYPNLVWGVKHSPRTADKPKEEE